MFKKYTILLILLVSFTYVKAQTILVNGSAVSVSQDVTFPFWLDSMSTVEIGTQVVSISALEFNIVPTANGNSLVFVQTKIITSQQTVPNGKTWKLEGVLLDSTATNTTTSSGGITVVSGGEKAVALSEQSASTMNMGDAMLYCDSLIEGGYNNWVVPTLEEIMYVAGGGGVVAGTRTADDLWSSSGHHSTLNNRLWIVNLNGSVGHVPGTSSKKLRCVRHESIAVSSSNGSSNPSTLGSGMPTMISNESDTVLHYEEAATYCDTLNENGFNDWILPSIDQLTYAVSGGCIIPDVKTYNYLWSRSASYNHDTHVQVLRLLNTYHSPYGSQLPARTQSDTHSESGPGYYTSYNPGNLQKCRCVR